MSASCPGPARLKRRRVLTWLLAGAASLGAVVVGWLRLLPRGGPGYENVARWRTPGGEGWFIAVRPEPTPDELRALGERLRRELRRLDNAVVMVFDDPEAARRVRQGSRVVGLERFEAALRHQRAMYLKSAERREESFTIYDRYPAAREVIRY